MNGCPYCHDPFVRNAPSWCDIITMLVLAASLWAMSVRYGKIEARLDRIEQEASK